MNSVCSNKDCKYPETTHILCTKCKLASTEGLISLRGFWEGDALGWETGCDLRGENGISVFGFESSV